MSISNFVEEVGYFILVALLIRSWGFIDLIDSIHSTYGADWKQLLHVHILNAPKTIC